MSTLVLVPAGTQVHPAARARRQLNLLLTALYVGLMLTVMLWMFGPGLDAWNILDLFARIGQRLVEKEKWVELAVVLVANLACVLALVWLSVFNPRRRLVIDDRGIHYTPGARDPLAFLHPAWSIAWSDLLRVDIGGQPEPPAGNYPWRPVLNLRTRMGKRSLFAFNWEPLGESTPPEPLRLTLRAPRVDWPARLAADPVVRALSARDRAPAAPDQATLPVWQRPLFRTAAYYDLERSPLGLALIGLFFAGAIAVFLQAFHLPYRYLGAPPWFLLGSIVLLAWPLFMHLLRRRAVPRVECGVVGALGALGCAGLAAAGAPYLNALTDPDTPRRVVMTMHADGHFEAAGVPRFAPPGFILYWSHVAPGEGYPFELQRGALGFWQYDARPLEAEFDAFLALDRGRSADAREHVRRLVVPRPELP